MGANAAKLPSQLMEGFAISTPDLVININHYFYNQIICQSINLSSKKILGLYKISSGGEVGGMLCADVKIWKLIRLKVTSESVFC